MKRGRKLGQTQQLLQLLRPFPGRLEFAGRTALICMLTTLAVEYFQTPEPALTAYVVFFLVKRDRVSSIIQSIAIVILLSIVISLVMLLTSAVIDEPLFRVSSMAIISFILVFAASASKLRSIGATVALIVAYSLDLMGNMPIGELAVRALLYGWLIAGIPAGICVIVNLLLGPAPRRLAEKALAQRLSLAARALESTDIHASELRVVMQEGTTEISQWIKYAALERTSPDEDIAALAHATQSLTPILLLVEMVARSSGQLLPLTHRAYLAASLDSIAEIFRNGEYPTDFSIHAKTLDAAMSPCSYAVWQEMCAALMYLCRPAETHASKLTKQAARHLHKDSKNNRSSGFFLPDAFSNPDHVRHALKTTGAAMFCYLIYSALNWPGIHTSLITCYIVALGTMGETIEKLRLRIAGCLVGSIAGVFAILYVMPDLSSIFSLLSVVFLGAILSAWVAGGSVKISYAGLQIAFAFFLCVIQGSSPAFNLLAPRDRVIGILFGNLVAYFMFAHVWPTSIASRVDIAFTALLRQLGKMTEASDISTVGMHATEALAGLNAIERDLALIVLEPLSIRPSLEWTILRRRTARQIGMLLGPLLVAGGRNLTMRQDISSRLLLFADNTDAIPSAQNIHKKKQGRNSRQSLRSVSNANYTLDELLESHMQNFERMLAKQVANTEKRGNYV